ncbi:hypothetical protein BH11ACT3_BH11ACT3_12630 [soil metagenome]
MQHNSSRAARHSGDAGFTLIEVLIAFILLAVVTTASLTFLIRANSTSAYQQHNQVAVTIASQAMEQVIGTTPSVSSLIADRYKNTVQTAWTNNATKDGVADTYQLWDAAATSGSVAAIPISSTSTVEGTIYSADTLIGICYRQRTSVNNAVCDKVPATDTAPTTSATPSGYVKVIRVMVIVRWTADDECPSGCSYEAATLIDANTDLEWLG